jgi:hypothetical protein
MTVSNASENTTKTKHKQVAIFAKNRKIEVDELIVPMIQWMNSLKSVDTFYSCQGNHKEGDIETDAFISFWANTEDMCHILYLFGIKGDYLGRDGAFAVCKDCKLIYDSYGVPRLIYMLVFQKTYKLMECIKECKIALCKNEHYDTRFSPWVKKIEELACYQNEWKNVVLRFGYHG